VFDHRYDHLSVFQWDDTRVVGSTDHGIITSDFLQGIHSNQVVTIGIRVGEILPWLEGFSIIRRSLKDPGAGSRGVGELDKNVGDVENLSKIDSDVDFVELVSAGERGTLPPFLGSIDSVVNWMGLLFTVGVTFITDLSLMKTRRKLKV
jgi:hypothetical protein